MLHGECLFFWSASSQQIKLISKNSSKILCLNETSFVCMVKQEKKVGEKAQEFQKINLIENRFSSL